MNKKNKIMFEQLTLAEATSVSGGTCDCTCVKPSIVSSIGNQKKIGKKRDDIQCLNDCQNLGFVVGNCV